MLFAATIQEFSILTRLSYPLDPVQNAPRGQTKSRFMMENSPRVAANSAYNHPAESGISFRGGLIFQLFPNCFSRYLSHVPQAARLYI